MSGITTYEKIVGKYVGPICAEKSQTRQQITNLVNLTADAISRDATGPLQIFRTATSVQRIGLPLTL